MKRLTRLFATVAAALLPISAGAQMPTLIDDVRQLSGDWEGRLGDVLWGITIKEDGSYEGLGWRGQPVSGQIVVKDGIASYKSNLNEGSVFLFKSGGGSALRFFTYRGGVSELLRTK